jgi:broad specificity phosphatase PhoE
LKKKETTTIYLVRHGRSRANETGVFAGCSDDPLLPEGRKEAEAAATLLAGRNISRIYSSPVARAMETAEIISRRLEVDMLPEPDISDIKIPSWEGRLKQEMLCDMSSGYSEWKTSPATFCPHSGETLADLQKRATNATTRLLEHHKGKNIVMVTHLAVARVIILALSDMPLDKYRDIDISNATPIEIVSRNAHITINTVK